MWIVYYNPSSNSMLGNEMTRSEFLKRAWLRAYNISKTPNMTRAHLINAQREEWVWLKTILKPTSRRKSLVKTVIENLFLNTFEMVMMARHQEDCLNLLMSAVKKREQYKAVNALKEAKIRKITAEKKLEKILDIYREDLSDIWTKMDVNGNGFITVNDKYYCLLNEIEPNYDFDHLEDDQRVSVWEVNAKCIGYSSEINYCITWFFPYNLMLGMEEDESYPFEDERYIIVRPQIDISPEDLSKA